MILGPNRLGHEPYPWQQRERAYAREPKRAIYASPRMGKTDIVALCLRDLAPTWTRGLVSAPLKVCPTWATVLQKAGIPVHALWKLPAGKFDAFFRSGFEGIAIVNRDKLVDAANLAPKLDVFVADESHNYASPSRTGRAHAYRKLARATPWVRALTGTPVPRHYGSLWSQLMPLRPDEWESSYEKFAQNFLIRDAMFPSRVLAHKNVDELQRRIVRVAGIYRREEEFGPDRYITSVREVDMPERSWALYVKLAREWIIDEPDIAVDASNAAVRLGRLQQLTSGFLPAADKDGETTLLHQAKIDAVIADLDEIFTCNEKAVIFHKFVKEGRVMHDEIARCYPHVPLYKLDGDPRKSTSQNDADIQAFARVDGPACFVVQIQSGSEGIKLASAHHALYLSRTFSFTDDEQSRDRIYAPGQPRFITYYEVPNTVDAFVSDLLANKRTIHNAIRNADRESLVFGPIRTRKRTA